MALALGAVAACSSSDGTGPTDEAVLPEELVGTWTATSMVLTSRADTTTSTDIVKDQSGQFTMELRSDGRYVATLRVFGQTQAERGEVEVSGGQLVFRPDDGGTDRVDWTLAAGLLILDGETTFDFNQDGTDEEALLHIELVRG